MSVIDQTTFEPVTKAIKDLLETATGRAWIVKLRFEHMDFQFEYLEHDWHRLTLSHGWESLEEPADWYALIANEAKTVLDLYRQTFGRPA